MPRLHNEERIVSSTTERRKRQPTEGEKVFANLIAEKVLMCKKETKGTD